MLGACVLVGACSVDGDAVAGRPDLAPRGLTAADFGSGAAAPIPPPAVGDALADVIGRASAPGAAVTPPGCAPAPIDSAGAYAILGPGRADRSTLTAAIAYADESLDAVAERVRRCPTYTTTLSQVAVTEQPAPPAPEGVQTMAIARTITTGGPGAEMVTSTLTLIAQRDDVRIYVDYRRPGAEPVTPEAGADLDALFTKAVAAAFG